MTRIKLCGLSSKKDILTACDLKPEYIGFVFYPKSSRYVTEETAAELKALLDHEISAAGVFVNEDMEKVVRLLNTGVIDMAQLHGSEDDEYIRTLKRETGKPVIKAFRVSSPDDLRDTEDCPADHVLFDSGAGGGKILDWSLLKDVKRDYFLAGGLNTENVTDAIENLSPFAVDVSSGIETDGRKDADKMKSFVESVRGFKTRR